MQLNFPWISEGSRKKAERALAELQAANVARKNAKPPQAEVAITEGAIKELYVRFGGLVVGEDYTRGERLAGETQTEMDARLARDVRPGETQTEREARLANDGRYAGETQAERDARFEREGHSVGETIAERDARLARDKAENRPRPTPRTPRN